MNLEEVLLVVHRNKVETIVDMLTLNCFYKRNYLEEYSATSIAISEGLLKF